MTTHPEVPQEQEDSMIRFWRKELPFRARSWWRRHWWPARIRQLDRERADWKRWHNETAEAAASLVGADQLRSEIQRQRAS